jgi:hypothetical protein
MYLGPLPVFAWGGIMLLVMTIFQVLVGAKILKIDFRFHKVNGFLILTFGIIHGTLALMFLLN